MSTTWRSSRDYRVWRANVIIRDKVCQVCGRGPTDGIKRHAHHLNSASYFPDEKYDIENGKCLCGDCHMNFHNNFKRSYRTKCTKYDYDNFIVLSKYLKIALCNKK